MSGIDQLKQDIEKMLDLQDKISTWVEASMWESRVDLSDFRPEKVVKIKHEITKCAAELHRLKGKWL